MQKSHGNQYEHISCLCFMSPVIFFSSSLFLEVLTLLFICYYTPYTSFLFLAYSKYHEASGQIENSQMHSFFSKVSQGKAQ